MSEENILQTPVHHNRECHDRDRHKSKLSEMHQVRKGEGEGMEVKNSRLIEKPIELQNTLTMKEFELVLNEVEINTIIACLSQVSPEKISSYGMRYHMQVMGYKEYDGQEIKGMEYWSGGYGHESLIRELRKVIGTEG